MKLMSKVKQRRIFTVSITAMSAIVLAVAVSQSASASPTHPNAPAANEITDFSVSYSNAVTIAGTVHFGSQTSGSKVYAVGYDYKSDGYGPYLKYTYIVGGSDVQSYQTSCAAGAGNSCTEYTIQSDFYATAVRVQACTGAGGHTVNCGTAKTIYP